MAHLTEEVILAVRDRERVDAEALAHIGECAVCAEALEEARARARAVEQALGALTVPLRVERLEEVESRAESIEPREAMAGVDDLPPPLEARVIPIGGGRGDARKGRGGGRRDAIRGTRVRGTIVTTRWLSRAAVLVLISAGALSALPGPFKGWIPRVFSGADVPAANSEPAAQAVEQVGGRMDVPSGPVAVQLEGVPPGTLIDVRRVARPSVGVYAGPGSEFAYGGAEVRANIVGGPVTVELPAGVVPATLVVNGGIYLVVRASGMEVPGPQTTAGEESLVTFRVPN